MNSKQIINTLITIIFFYLLSVFYTRIINKRKELSKRIKEEL